MRSSEPATGSVTPGMGDYFTIGELGSLLARRKLLLAALTIAGALAGALFAWTQPPAWTASALVQIGQVGLASPLPGNPEAFGVAIEPVARAAERVRNRAFVRALLQRLDLPDTDSANDPDARLIRRSLEVTMPRATDLLEIRVDGYSPESARKAARTVIAMLAEEHAKLAEPTLARLSAQLRDTSAQLDHALQQRAKLTGAIAAQGQNVRPSDRFAESVLLSQMLSSVEQEIRTLRHLKLTLEEQLSPKRTFATALLTDIDVPDRPSSPKKVLSTVAGAGLGLLAGIAWVLMRRPRKR